MFGETKIRQSALDGLGGWHCQPSVCIRLLVVSNLFGIRDQFCRRQFFHGLGGERGMIWGTNALVQKHYIYCTLYFYYCYVSVQFSHSVMSSCLWLQGEQHARPPCPSLIPELTQTHVHWVGDAIQPSHPLSSPSPPAFTLSQHQGLFQWISSSH